MRQRQQLFPITERSQQIRNPAMNQGGFFYFVTMVIGQANRPMSYSHHISNPAANLLKINESRVIISIFKKDYFKAN